MGRSLASPKEVMTALREAVTEPDSLVFSSHEWKDISIIEMAFPTSGRFVASPLAYYSISTFTGDASYLAEDGSKGSEPPRLPKGATLIHQVGRGANYVWTQPHTARMTCLDPRVVQRAAEETGLVNPCRIEIPSSFRERDVVCESLVAALAEESRVGHAAMLRFVAESIATAMAMRLLSRSLTFRSQSASPKGGLTASALARVHAYVRENFGEISLETLAELSGVSRFHFARQFRVSTGESPMAYVRRIRIEVAKQKLKDGRESGAEIATLLGFADQSHFSRTFKQVTGLSPTTFASLHRS